MFLLTLYSTDSIVILTQNENLSTKYLSDVKLFNVVKYSYLYYLLKNAFLILHFGLTHSVSFSLSRDLIKAFHFQTAIETGE